jgi:nucleotide-binding universal stress UspA family protein
MISIRGILVPVDFSKESVLAAKFAASLAEEYKAKLYVLFVRQSVAAFVRTEVADWDSLERRMADQAMKDLAEVVPQKVKERISVEEISIEGHAVHHSIVEKATELEVDLIVIATHGRTGLAHVVLGSVAEHIIRHAPCPVLVVRNPKDKYVYGWEK